MPDVTSAADIYLKELQEQICRVGIDYRFWVTYFFQSIDNFKSAKTTDHKAKAQREIEESERYVKLNRKKMFDLIETYSRELSAKNAGVLPPAPPDE